MNIFKKTKVNLNSDENKATVKTKMKKYDSENRIIWEKDDNDFVREFEYHTVWRNKFSRVTSSYPPKFDGKDFPFSPREKKYYYNERGDVILVEVSCGSRVEYEYDERGNLIKQTEYIY